MNSYASIVTHTNDQYTINLQKFEDEIKQKYLISGKQNNNLLTIVKQAKFYELEKQNALSIIKNNWVGKFEKSDLNSFEKDWDKVQVDKTISDYKKQNLKQKIQQIKQKQIIEKQNLNNDIFQSYLNNVEQYELPQVSLTKTTKDLLNWYDKNDIIWISKNREDISSESFKDMLSFSESKYPLKMYSYMSINPFNSMIYKRSCENIKTFRYFLIQSDNLSLEKQYKLFGDMIRFGIPIKSVVFSGGKSFHILCYLPSKIENISQYDDYVGQVYKLLLKAGNIFDQAAKNASRLTRIPFGSYDKHGDHLNDEQTVFYINKNLKSDVDTLTKFKEYFESIGLKIEQEKNTSIINENEILFYVDGNIIKDIWREGSNYFVKHVDFVDKTTFKIEKFTSKTSCYDFCWQYRDKVNSNVFDEKDWRELKVVFKQTYFHPTLKQNIQIYKDKFNTFTPGWLGDIINDNKISLELNKPLKQLLKNIFGDDQKTKKWTLKWMNHYMHHFCKMKTAPVFWGKPGIGKSMLAECFGDAIGDWKAPKQNQIEDIRFNNWIKHAVLILDEVSSGSKKDGKSFGDYLKGLITQEYQSIQNKGIDNGNDVRIDNCFIFTANINDYLPPVFLEQNDRRYTIIRNDDAENLIDIWTDEDFENWNNKSYQYILIKYIYNLNVNSDEFKQINIIKGLDTKYKAEIQDMSKNNVQKLAEEFMQQYKGSGFLTNNQITYNLQNVFGQKDPGRSFRSALVKLGAKRIRKTISGQTFLGYEF